MLFEGFGEAPVYIGEHPRNIQHVYIAQYSLLAAVYLPYLHVYHYTAALLGFIRSGVYTHPHPLYTASV